MDLTRSLGIDSQATIQSASSMPPASNANDADSLQNEFLTLMVSQIQNQDPLNPADGTEYVSQLAQFSQVESSENMVQLMNNQMVMLDNMQTLTMSQLVGDTVSVRTDSFIADDETTFKGSFNLSHASNTVRIELTDEAGEVTIVNLPPSSKGKVDFEIDTDSLNLTGRQRIEVILDEGQDYTPQIVMSGEVQNVSIPQSGEASMLDIIGIGKLPFYEISEFS